MPQRKPLRILLGIVYSLAVAFIMLEIFLRLFDPIGIGYYPAARKYFGAMTPDPDFAYIHTPKDHLELEGVKVDINSEGLRSPEFPVQKPVGEKRLLLIGDSVVFGWGTAQDSIMSAFLQRDFNATAPEWDVIAAGVGSWNTRTEYEWLRKRGLEYDPDAILWLIVSNDVEPKTAGRTVVDKALLEDAVRVRGFERIRRKLLRGAARLSYVVATYGFFERVLTGGHEYQSLYDADSPTWRDAGDALDSFVALCRERGIELIVFVNGKGSPGYSDAYYHAYTGRLDDLSVPYYSVSPSVFAPENRNSLVDSHPNPHGHRLIADEMFAVLRDRLGLESQ